MGLPPHPPGTCPGGLFANGGRTENLARARQLLAMPAPAAAADADQTVDADEPPTIAYPCPCCGGSMIIIETFERGNQPRAPPIHGRGIDSP